MALVVLLAAALVLTFVGVAGAAPDARFAVSPTDPAEYMSGENWLAEASIDITVDDPDVTGTVNFARSLTSDDEGGFEVFDLPFDFKPGQTVSVTDGTTTKSHVVLDLAVEGFDIDTDGVWGRGEPDSVVTVVAYSPILDVVSQRTVSTDATGAWAADFSTPGSLGELELDLGAGTSFFVYQQDGDDDQTQVNAQVPNPQFSVNPVDDRIDGSEWAASGEVTVTVEDTATGTSPDLEVAATCDGRGDFFIDELDFDLESGQVVTVTDGTASKTTTITSVTVTEIDRAADTISGTAAPGSEVRVDTYAEDGPQRFVTADSEGDWQADFSEAAGPEPWQGVFDIDRGSEGGAAQEDDDGDQTQVEWHVPNPQFAVDPTHERLEGQQWTALAEVTITVEDPDTGTSPDFETTATCDTWGGFDTDNLDFDLEASQTVTVTDGTTTKSTVVKRLTVTEVDPVADTVSGTASPGTEIRVSAYTDDNPERFVTADSEGDWQADFSQVGGSESEQQLCDIVAGTDGDASQQDEDSDQTQVDWNVPNPRFSVQPAPERVNGWEWPASAEVTITVEDPSTGTSPDFEATATCDGWGGFETDELSFDLKSGQTVTVDDGATSKSTTITAVAVTEIDVAADTISGTAAPSSEVRVEVSATEPSERFVTADSEGDWQADFSEEGTSGPWQPVFDLVAGSEGSVRQEDADGDQTEVQWNVANPQFGADPAHEFVHGREWPASADVTITVEDTSTGTSPDLERTATCDEAGEFEADLLGFDLKSGQTVTVTDGTTTKATIVTSLTVTQVDPAADTISGTASPGSEVWVDVYDDSGVQRVETADAEGDWQADFSEPGGLWFEERTFDLVGGSEGNVHQADDDEDQTEVYWTVSAPEAIDDEFGVSEDTTLTQAAPGLLANDTYYPGSSTAAAVTQPAHGTLVLNSQTGAFTYRPASNWHGADRFTYRLTEGELLSAPATVTITVASVNDVPISSDDTAAVAANTTLTVAAPGVLDNDADADEDTLTTVLATTTAHGTLALHADGSYAYRPETDWAGTDRFWYRATDGVASSVPTTVTITVRDGAAPQLAHDARASYIGTAVIHLSGTDPAPGGAMDYLQWRLMKDGVATPVQANTVHSSTSANDVVTVTQPGSYHLYVDVQDQAGNEMDQVDIAFTVSALPLPAAKLTVSTPGSVKRSKNFYVTGKLTPAHPSATTIMLRFERYYKRKWRLAKKATVRLAAGATTYRYKVKLSPKGSWRVVASHGADSAHTGKPSATRKFRVK